MKHKDKGRLPPFVPVDLEMMNSPAWRATSHGARWLYMHLKRRWSFRQKNNGRIFLSHLDAVKEMGGTPDSISRWFRELQHYGFIVMTEPGCLGVDGKGKAPHWRLTEAEWPGGRNGNTWMLPTKNYLKWDGMKFRDDRGDVLRQRERRGREKKEKKQDPTPEIQGRAPRKSRVGPPRKSRVVRPATTHDIQGISDTSPTHDIQGISSITTSTAVSADRSPSSLPPAPQDVAPPARKPWTTPTVTEVSFDDLPIELRMMALGLSAEEAVTLATLEPDRHA
jgi:hypothetical protein